MNPNDVERFFHRMFAPAEFQRFLRGREAFDSRFVAELPSVQHSEAEYFSRVVLLLHQYGYLEDEEFYLDLLAARGRWAEGIGLLAASFHCSDVAMTARVLDHASKSPRRLAVTAAEPLSAQIRRLHAAIRRCRSMELAEGHAVAREIGVLAGRVVEALRVRLPAEHDIVDTKPDDGPLPGPLLERTALLKTLGWLLAASLVALIGLGPIFVGIVPVMLAPTRLPEREAGVQPSCLPVVTSFEPPQPMRRETRRTRAVRTDRKVRTPVVAPSAEAEGRPQIPALPKKLAADLVEQTLLKALKLDALTDFSVRLVVRPDGGVDRERTHVSTVYGEEGAKVLGLPFPPTQQGSGALLCYVIKGSVKAVRCEAT